MNVATINRLPNIFEGLGFGSRTRNGRAKLNKKQRAAFRETRKIWLDMALRIINSTEASAPLVLGITSTTRGEGKTTNCVGIASAISRETDEKVLMLECDLVNPSLASQLNLFSAQGLAESIQGYIAVEETIQNTPLPNLDIIPAGGTQGAEVGELDVLDQPLLSALRRKLPGMLEEFRRSYGFILLDMPPVLNSPYTRDIVKFTDSTFLSVKAGVTSSESLALASDMISAEKLSGVILVGSDSPLPSWMVNLLEG